MNRLWLVSGVVTLLLGLLSAAFLAGMLPAWLVPPRNAGNNHKPGGAHCSCDLPKTALAGAAVPDAATPAREATRFTVCAREEAPATLSLVRIQAQGAQLLAVHCGPSVHLIALQQIGEQMHAQRLAVFSPQSPEPALAPRPGPVADADLDGDGLRDLLVSILLVDSAGSPSGGALYVLRQREQGGLLPPKRLMDLAPAALVAGSFDALPGDDLLLLHRSDPRTARENELWVVQGGAAPLRTRVLPAGSGPAAIGAADLDRDGQSDFVVASQSSDQLRLWLTAGKPQSADAPQIVTLGPSREIAAGDLDGDGHRDLILVGDKIHHLRRNESGQLGPIALADAGGLRGVQLIDADADDALDLVGYAHPDLVALLQRPGMRFERQTLAAIEGAPSVLAAQLIGESGAHGLALLLVSDEGGGQIELALASYIRKASRVRLAQQAHALDDAALVMHAALP